MSRVGKMPVNIPAGVKVSVNDNNTLTVKGPRGELVHKFDPRLQVSVENSHILVATPNDPLLDAMHGLTRALINNMVHGVTEGYRRTLEIEGVGYRAELQGKNVVLSVGLSHSVPVEPPPGITFTVDKTNRVLTIEGNDRQTVGEVAAHIRNIRPPEPYKGKGVRYQGEKVRRKAGKAGKVGAK